MRFATAGLAAQPVTRALGGSRGAAVLRAPGSVSAKPPCHADRAPGHKAVSGNTQRTARAKAPAAKGDDGGRAKQCDCYPAHVSPCRLLDVHSEVIAIRRQVLLTRTASWLM